MYFINIKQLKQDIINRDFTEKDRYIYMFLYLLGCTFFWLLDNKNKMGPTVGFNVVDMSTTFVLIIGTYFLYKANGGSKGEDFAGRYFSIVWIVAIRWFVPYLLFVITLWSIIGISADKYSRIFEVSFTIFSFSYGLYMAIVYYCSYGHMTDVSKKVEDES